MNTNNIKSPVEAASKGIVPHALILAGENSLRLMNTAKAFAKACICPSGSCGKCTACLKIKESVHPDVIIVSGNKKNGTLGVDDIRSIRSDVFIKPNEAKFKIYILKESDKMTVQAQNAILKILEEPPGYAVFILLCSHVSAMLDTVRSRCRIYIDSESNPGKKSKAYEIALSIACATVSSGEWNLYRAIAPALRDRKILKDVTVCLRSVFAQAFILKNSGRTCTDTPEEIKTVADQMNNPGFIEITESLDNIDEMLDRNVNINLLSSFICIKLRNSHLNRSR